MLGLVQRNILTYRISSLSFSDSKTWQFPVFLFLFYSIISLAILAPISSIVFIPNLADYMNHLAATIQAKTAITEGQFPLRIAPQEFNGWLYPYYQFYSPTVYTLSGLIYKWISPANPLIAFKITMWCALMLGTCYMFRLAYWFIPSRPAAILASVVYLYSPYYIILINHLGNL